MVNKDIINKFGYSEMYEWSELFNFNVNPFGKFVTFDNDHPGKIILADNSYTNVIGVTTINSVITSDDPEEWQGKYLSNEYGDRIMKYVDSELKPIINPDFNNQEYIKRSDRKEWIRVNLLGKCIVEDNGECIPGQRCTIGKNGIAIPYTLNNGYNIPGWYVIDRLSENTIMIFFK